MRQNPHVRICGGPGSATTLVYPTHLWQLEPALIHASASDSSSCDSDRPIGRLQVVHSKLRAGFALLGGTKGRETQHIARLLGDVDLYHRLSGRCRFCGGAPAVVEHEMAGLERRGRDAVDLVVVAFCAR